MAQHHLIHSQPFTTDVFTIPYKDGYILHIPEPGLVAGVDAHFCGIIEDLKQNRPIEDTANNRELLTVLETLQVFAPKPVPAAEPPAEYRPTDVTLSLTSRCHLRCVYCYARAGDKIQDMPTEIIDAALYFVADNTVWHERNSFIVGFHGEGEPTANWPLFRHAIEQAKRLARERGLEVTFTMSSNGIWSPAQREYLADCFANISLSFDGPSEIQDAQRPMASGAPSFPTVFENLQFLESKGVDYGIRATVLPTGLDSMVPFLNLISEELECNYVHFEPVFFTGRGIDHDLGVASTDAFYQGFLDAYQKAVTRGGELGISVTYSGCRATHFSTNFCGSTGPDPNFFVSTSGIVSSCFEIIDPTSAKGQFTVYGRYDPGARRFVFDHEKLEQLWRFGVDSIAHCKDCFARWNCSGDCFARSDISLENGAIVASQESPRCQANRETTLQELVRRGLVMDALSRSDQVSAITDE